MPGDTLSRICAVSSPDVFRLAHGAGEGGVFADPSANNLPARVRLFCRIGWFSGLEGVLPATFRRLPNRQNWLLGQVTGARYVILRIQGILTISNVTETQRTPLWCPIVNALL